MLDAKQLVSELQDLRDSGHLSDALLRYAVRGVEKADSRYDWVGVYLVDQEKNDLWLHNYMGSPTEHARIPMGEGISGTAVQTGGNIIIDDVSEAENYLECDEDTQSEMVVLIRAGDDIFGEITMDSSEKAAFNAEDEELLVMVADKLAEQLAAERR